SEMLLPPSASYLLGTDQFGRDILTRLLYGAQTALFVGCTAAFIGATSGLVLGVTSAYLGGRFDLLFQRVTDVFQAFPL
ncbi:MAG: ABC transporter permease, partial [Gammaproteobacteria bacterium]|nr:ABC transporter permease [Gammaproteobacteria bacterium]NIT16627.1 ABC transporter permease [Gammaproteobacteria bacterium]